jgi:uncharacterized RDD family membrane protein YckC
MASSDKLIIETPEQTSLDFPLAGIGSRFLAMVADTAIQGVTAFLLVLVIAYATPGLSWLGTITEQWAFALLFLAIFLIYSGYFAFFEAIWNGQTPGKRYAQLRVMKDDGRPISAYDAIARNLMRAVDSLPAFYGVGVLSVLISKSNKRLGDFVAGTVVVHEKALEGARPFLDTAKPADGPVFNTAAITPDELRLIETFFSRRDGLDPSIRTSMAAQIARRIGEKLNVRVVGWPQTEHFLESVLDQYRSTGRFSS